MVKSGTQPTPSSSVVPSLVNCHQSPTTCAALASDHPEKLASVLVTVTGALDEAAATWRMTT